MGSTFIKPLAHKLAATAALVLLAGSAFAQSPTVIDLRGAAPGTAAVNLTAQPVNTTIAGATIPMWGYCASSYTGAAGAVTVPACTTWAPGPTIIANAGALTINLTNNLATPTSLVVLGQLGGGLGTPAKFPSGPHNLSAIDPTQVIASLTRVTTVVTVKTTRAHGYTVGSTVTISGFTGTSATYNGVNLPITAVLSPTSFTIAHADSGPANASLNAATQVTGTVAFGARNTTTFPGNGAGAFVAPVQPDRVRSFGTEALPGAMAALSWSALKPGTYLYETGTHPSIQAPMGLYGVLVVTDGVTGDTAGNAYTGVPYDAAAVALISEIDPVQNAAVAAVAAATVSPALIDESKYPFAVNYAPTYFLLNGRSFDSTQPALSAVQVAVGAPASNNVLLRFVNAGLRTHVPAFVGLSQSLVAEDGNVAPGNRKLQSELLLPAGKTADVLVTPAQTVPGTYDAAAVALFDRELSTTTDNTPNGGLHGYLVVAAAGADPTSIIGTREAGTATAVAVKPVVIGIGDSLTSFTGNALASSTGVSNAALGVATTACPFVPSGLASVAPQSCTDAGTGQKITLNPSGTFTVTPGTSGYVVATSFNFYANGSTALAAVVTLNVTSGVTATITPLSLAFPSADVNLANSSFWSVRVSSVFHASAPGVLADSIAKDIPAALVSGDGTVPGLPLTAQLAADTGGTKPTWVTVNPDGSFTATNTCGTSPCVFNYVAVDSLGHASAPASVAISFPTGSGLQVDVADAPTRDSANSVSDYNWIIEEDTTWVTEPGKTPPLVNGVPPPSLATSFHSSFMPVVATGCTGPSSCGDSQVVTNGPAPVLSPRSLPGDVVLDPTRRYYLSVLPGDSANPTINGNAFINHPGQPAAVQDPAKSTTCLGDGTCGHTMAGVNIGLRPVDTTGALLPYQPVTVLAQRNPIKPAQLSIYIYADNAPTNGQNDESEDGLGGFEITVVDAAGRPGDVAGTITYDAFNMPLSNALLGTPGCPDVYHTGNTGTANANLITGVIYTCPEFDTRLPARQRTLLPLAGHAVIKNIMPGRFDVIARPGADRAKKGEVWYQTETLEGTPAQDAFAKAAEPIYFQEFGSPGFHSTIGFMNPAVVKAQNTALITPRRGQPAPVLNTITGKITSLHMSRPVEETMHDSGTYEPMSQTTCLVTVNQGGVNAELGNAVGFAQCDKDGNFSVGNIPAGEYELFIWDEWLDQIKAFKAMTVPNGAAPATVAMGNVPVFSWFTRVEEGMFNDANHNGIWESNEQGLSNLFITMRYRDGSISNVLQTDSSGHATFTELFPLFNWYVTEADETRYHLGPPSVTVDAGGAPDTSATAASPITGLDGTAATVGPFPGLLASSYKEAPAGTPLTTSRVDGDGVVTEGIQGFINQTQIINWSRWVEDTCARLGTTTDCDENGGIAGIVVFASTRGFDDPRLLVQNLWEPAVANVRVNLYRETPNADGTISMQLVDWTTSFSWDRHVNEVQGIDGTGAPMVDTAGNPVTFIRGADLRLRDPITGALAPAGVTAGPQANMSCPGQTGPTVDPFVATTLGAANQFRCYDGFHMWNQVQPAVYDGGYIFPTDNYLAHKPANIKPGSLEPGKYVVEIVLPPGYEVAKEEDKNILIGDAWIAPVAQQFGALADLYILPDQAVLAEFANSNNPGLNNLTLTEGFQPGPIAYQPCVGRIHRVPDYLTLFPDAQQVAPYAGADKPLCDRKEVTMQPGGAGGASFYVFTPTPPAAHYTGLILDDAASEVNKYAPDFGEKFAVPYAPVSIRDFTGTEISRVYSDQWGNFNGLAPSTWEVNVPNPSGYSPNMLVLCMNDPGPIDDPAHPGQKITDPQFNPMFSNFCYTWPFMPGRTTYLDTPVLPVAAFADGYNPPDCAYPDATPAIRRVDAGTGSAFGPYLPTTGGTLTLTALGDESVSNPLYVGPSAIDPLAPNYDLISKKTIIRHYGFGGAPGVVTLTSDSGVVTTLSTSSWADGSISANVGALPAGSYQLGISTAAGKSSVDSIKVTIGGAAPLRVSKTATGAFTTIQSAIDTASPGALILVDEGQYNELVVMWKPVQLQGVGAPAVVINAAKYPTEKLEKWRPFINTLFGLDPVDPNNTATRSQIDTLPSQQPITGGVILLEPTILATEEGAGVTVLAKDGSTTSCTSTTTSQSFGVASYSVNGIPMTATNAIANLNPTTGLSMRMSDSVFGCGRKARIDGISITGSDTGGGIYVNGYAHGLEISNNRIYGNASPMHGGIRVGSPFEEEVAPDTNGYGYDIGVNIHHNAITRNGTVEGMPGATGAINQSSAGAGVSICSGTDNYRVNYNFICGNFSGGDGGGIGHLGVSMNGVIAHNQVLFNQSFQQTQSVNGGGIVIEGEGQNLNTPANIPPGEGAPTVNTPFGTGNVTIDSNLIVGNLAESGHGGGIRVQQANGQDVSSDPTRPDRWYRVTIKNNVIMNNVAAWGGGGISLADTVNAVIVNNTIVSNDSVGIVGETLSVSGGTVTGPASPSGIASDPTSAPFLADLPTVALRNQLQISSPVLFNNIVWKNRSFYFLATQGGAAGLCASSSKTAATCTALTVADTDPAGFCPAGAAYWDLGVVGDTDVTTPNTALSTAGTLRLNPRNSILSDPSSYNASNSSLDPTTAGLKMYCNGSRANPDAHFEPGGGFQSDFFIAPSMALDEMGNFVNVHYGPLSLTDPMTNLLFADAHLTNGIGVGAASANGLTIVNTIPVRTLSASAPSPDFEGDLRPSGTPRRYDAGADQFASVHVSPSELVFYAARRTTSPAQTVTVTNPSTTAAVNLGTLVVPAGFAIDTTGTTCGASLAVSASCTVAVTFAPTAAPPAVITGTLDLNEGGLMLLTGNVVRPTYSITPSPLQFGSLTRGTGATLPLTVTNTTSNANLLITAIPARTGADNALFSSASNTCTGLANGLAPGGTCTINVTFASVAATPYGAKQANQNITVDSGQGGSAQLRATVSPPPATLSATALNFANQVVGSSSAVPGQFVTLTNPVGNPTLTGINVGFSSGTVTANGTNAGFSPQGFGRNGTAGLAQNCGANLAAGSSCRIYIRFRGRAPAGPKADTLTIGGNGANVVPISSTVALSGTAT